MKSTFGHLWNLDPEFTYLNHGSFGPSPIAVRDTCREWSDRPERQPMRFFCQEMEDALDASAEALARFVGTKPERLALIDNATFAMNVAANSIELSAGDEVLLTDHEYGAVRRIWQERCRQTGAILKTVSLPFPLNDNGVVEAIAAAATGRTRVIVISHVTSPTAAVLPVQRVCAMARAKNITTVVDGPHAVAMLDLQLDQLGADYYCGSCHKWLCAPFGSGFVWVHPKHHDRVRCPIVSWGGSIAGRPASWQDRINWLGTRDPSALLSIPAAIEFLEDIGLQTFREHAGLLIALARDELLALEGVGPLCTAESNRCISMCSVELPRPPGWKPGYHGEANPLQLELRHDHGIEVPVGSWNGRRYLRVSAHLYNDERDIRKLLNALRASRNFA